MKFPSPKISTEQWNKFLKDPEIVTLEILFVFLILSNIFVLFRILKDVCPFPVLVTWFQLVVGALIAVIFGEASFEFPQCSYFPRFSIDFNLYQGLALPTLVFLGMITLANVLLNNLPFVASFPVTVSLAVFLHHVGRFVGCGQIYLPIRWISLAIMLFGFVVGLIDPTTIGLRLLPVTLGYALFASVYRAWCLEKAMHVVEGQGNTLHNHQLVLGIILLLPLSFLCGELEVFKWMPINFGKLVTWQSWGTLVVAGSIPFIKNVIANRLIKRTGPAPWRVLEAAAMVFVFLFGWGFGDSVSFAGVFAFILVFIGRLLGTLDALTKDPEESRRAMRQEAEHGVAPPQDGYDPTGVSHSFDHLEMLIENDGKSMEDKCFQMIRQDQEIQSRPSVTLPRRLMETIPEEVQTYL